MRTAHPLTTGRRKEKEGREVARNGHHDRKSEDYHGDEQTLR